MNRPAAANSAIAIPGAVIPIGERPAAALGDIERWIDSVSSRQLDNGLKVCVAADSRSPLVASAIAYRAGTRDEMPGQGGVAHFLEHMMFKGSGHFDVGEIDRLTQAAGGTNNAFTSHDSTLYYFTFAADRWRLALDIEADRMAGLRLARPEVDSERQVIHEEISMYEGEPWDMLLQDVRSVFFGSHPYGRPILGTRDELDAIGAPELANFHARFYQPSNAVVVVVGDVDIEAAHDAVAERFGAPGVLRPELSAASFAAPDAAARARRRIERHQGELARLEVAFSAPAVDHPDHALLRLLCGVLTLGRSSRLHRRLVDEQQLCLWVSADVQETLDPGLISVTAEAVPGQDAARIEAEILGALQRLRAEPPTPEEIARVRQVLLADWLFGHERLDQRAFLLAGASAFGDLRLPARSLSRLLAAGPDDLVRVAGQYFRSAEAIVGWSWPESKSDLEVEEST